jgi:hypothetical protein
VGDAERTPEGTPRRRLASMVSVRPAPEEPVVIRQAAESAGLSVSAFRRQAALGAADRAPESDGQSELVTSVGRNPDRGIRQATLTALLVVVEVRKPNSLAVTRQVIL